MKPAIGIDAEGLVGEVAEVCGFVDALEQREEACMYQSGTRGGPYLNAP